MQVLLVGDSHTVGSYGSNLRAFFLNQKAEVTKLAYVGARAYDYTEGSYKAEFDALKDRPFDVAIITLGTNDAAWSDSYPIQKSASDMRKIYDALKNTPHVFYVGPPSFSATAAATYNKVFARENLNSRSDKLWRATAPLFAENHAIDPRAVTKPFVPKGDIHLGPKGGEAWAKQVFAHVNAVMAGKKPELPKGKSIVPAVVIGATVATAVVLLLKKRVPTPAVAGLPKKGRIPLETAERALHNLPPRSQKCKGMTANALREGMEIEREHRDITQGRVGQTARIAAAHICERPDYYRRIKRYVE